MRASRYLFVVLCARRRSPSPSWLSPQAKDGSFWAPVTLSPTAARAAYASSLRFCPSVSAVAEGDEGEAEPASGGGSTYVRQGYSSGGSDSGKSSEGRPKRFSSLRVDTTMSESSSLQDGGGGGSSTRLGGALSGGGEEESSPWSLRPSWLSPTKLGSFWQLLSPTAKYIKAAKGGGEGGGGGSRITPSAFGATDGSSAGDSSLLLKARFFSPKHNRERLSPAELRRSEEAALVLLSIVHGTSHPSSLVVPWRRHALALWPAYYSFAWRLFRLVVVAAHVGLSFWEEKGGGGGEVAGAELTVLVLYAADLSFLLYLHGLGTMQRQRRLQAYAVLLVAVAADFTARTALHGFGGSSGATASTEIRHSCRTN